MGARRKGREYALQAMYLMDVAKLPVVKAINGIIRDSKVDKKALVFAENLAKGMESEMEALDKLIMKYAENWDLKRMAALDRNILRLGAYEFLHEPETPASVIIDEAVEIAKNFSTEDSGKFVNGILDKIKNDRPR